MLSTGSAQNGYTYNQDILICPDLTISVGELILLVFHLSAASETTLSRRDQPPSLGQEVQGCLDAGRQDADGRGEEGGDGEQGRVPAEGRMAQDISFAN